MAAYCKKIKQLLTLIEENRKYIENERSKQTIDLKNTAEITNWENRMKTDGTAIAKFYASWIKLHESQQLKLLNKVEEEINVPVVRKLKKRTLDEKNAEDSEEESELEFRVKGAETEETKTERERPSIKTKKLKKKKKVVNNIEDDDLPKDNTDIVQDINDWD